MKKLLLLLVSIALLSCATTKSSAEKPSKKTLKGTWTVENVRFVGDKGLYKANLFDFADSPCFKGSTWVFIPNNGSGKFTTNTSPSQCNGAGTRIHWSFFEPGDGTYQFQFKYVNEKNKPTDPANRGYRARIDELNATQFIMRVATTYEGNPFDVILTFNKTSEDFTL